MKICTCCKAARRLEEFYRSSKSRDGFGKRCKKCDSENKKRSYQKHREERMENNRRWQRKNLPIRRAQARRWAVQNKDKLAAAMSRFQKKHPERVNANTAAYEAAKRGAIPKWANKFFISEAYDLAICRIKATGFKWQVDHIVPLRSKKVCGLHVENNLQVIPAKENQRKRNYYWLGMP